jgi:hypothetical protein
VYCIRLIHLEEPYESERGRTIIYCLCACVFVVQVETRGKSVDVPEESESERMRVVEERKREIARCRKSADLVLRVGDGRCRFRFTSWPLSLSFDSIRFDTDPQRRAMPSSNTGVVVVVSRGGEPNPNR